MQTKKYQKIPIAAIVAIDQNRGIGYKGNIPWYLPADLKYFKKTTLGHPVIMGRVSFESIGRPLPGRTNIVISRDPFYLAQGVQVAHQVDEAFRLAMSENPDKIFVIGGAEIYKLTQSYWDELFLTEVKASFPCDTFFPALDMSIWTEISRESHPADHRNEFACDFVVYKRATSTEEEE